jgi:hypothetical protein
MRRSLNSDRQASRLSLQPLTSLDKTMNAMLSRLRIYMRCQLNLCTLYNIRVIYFDFESQKCLEFVLMQLFSSQITLPREASQPTPFSTNASINTTVLLIGSLAVTKDLFSPAIQSGVVCILSSLARIALETSRTKSRY